MNSTIDLNTYECSGEGLILPAINEYTWSIGARAFLYLLGMLWCFLGIAIVADTFMCGIEKITSKTRVIQIPDPDSKGGVREVEVKVWNDTVANLSLMAFGTSAPEILLSVIEICGKGFKAGELGPGTIVGSAAFNLFAITAMCIVSIPNGQVRRISNMGVYAVTTSFSMFAYLWMIVVLMFSSPGEVELWEAILTFLMFPTLILVSFAVDKGCWCRKNKTSSEVEIGIVLAPPRPGHFSPSLTFQCLALLDQVTLPLFPANWRPSNNGFSGVSAQLYKTRSTYFSNSDDKNRGDDDGGTGTADIIHMARELGRNKDISEEDAAKLAAAKLSENQHHSSLWYRIHATRNITGGHKLVPQINKALHELYEQSQDKIARQSQMGSHQSLSMIDLTEGGNKAVVEFTAPSCAVLENEGNVRIGIRRYGCCKKSVTVMVETIDGTAEAGSDYKPLKEKIVFNANETKKEVHVVIVDDDVWEPDEIFFVKLWIDDSAQDVVLGKTVINQVTIINDDEPGKFEFSKPSYIVNETSGKAQLFVNRVNGADGSVAVSWRSRDLTAINGKDYIGGEGSLTFEHGETSKVLVLSILDSGLTDREHSFQVELVSPTGGAEIGRIGKAIVTLVNDEEFEGLVSRITNQTMKNLDGLRLDSSSWGEQFHDAMNVNGGDAENATVIDYIMHFCTFFWKVMFATLIPPTSIGGGWLTFSFSLMVIGFLTAIVGDLASIFGCLIGLKKTVTAITLVALGTSMPDLFASKQAAVGEKTADSSVGNINGSNAVNVFLGLGLPWLIATIYWGVKGERFIVPTDALGFTVVLYTAFAIFTLVILMIRRKFAEFGKAELGGPVRNKFLSAFLILMLWFIYVILSSLNAYKIFNVPF
ncbi:sodium/calcium exchanger 2-like isoform X2 [Mizuhopecten yessoensis]|uniref:sodium/calcium exchanger 2-like isoform X2 n=1 Tax=Mizuhopecten yessoensis TaxID=6573 RepID=UPI000B45CFE3|nr:sodium/calcium exchanger 2-like isoform X2 [Mizuhopecten yessoensis]